MSYFAVIREAGPAWTDGPGIAGPAAVSDHAAFMAALAADGFVLCAGPLRDRERAPPVNAESEAEVHHRLHHDPWAASGNLETVSVEPWTVFVGDQPLMADAAPDHDSALSRPRCGPPAPPPRRCARGSSGRDGAWRRSCDWSSACAALAPSCCIMAEAQRSQINAFGIEYQGETGLSKSNFSRPLRRAGM